MVAVLCSLVAAFFYVRVIVLMFFSDLRRRTRPTWRCPGWQTTAAVALGLAATVVLGVVPGPVLDLAARAGEFIR